VKNTVMLLVLAFLAFAGCGEESEQLSFDNMEGGKMFVVFDQRNSQWPCYSPDGSQILFVFEDNLWTIPAAGGKPTRRSNLGNGTIMWPDWKPVAGSNTVCFVLRRGPDDYALMVMDLDGSPGEVHGSSKEILSTSWSRDGEYILFVEPSRGKGIFKLPAAGGEPVLVPNKNGWGSVFCCKCSPGSDTVIYPESHGTEHYIYRISIDGGVPEQVVKSPVSASQAAESHDGKYIAFVGTGTSGQAEGTDLWIGFTATGTAKRAASRGSSFKFNYPNWSPDDSNIVFHISQRIVGGAPFTYPRIYRLELDPGFL